ncbi:MAG TPA: hypothetical protein VIY86_10350 [Pirellulaceae bacterium]
MMNAPFSTTDLESYLDEALDTADMKHVEDALRSDRSLVTHLVEIQRHRDQGLHTLGAIWRRHRLSCPNREELGGFLLGALEGPASDYIYFHITEIGCRMCQANLKDLEDQHQKPLTESASRRKKYFQTSAGLLRKE